MQLFKKFLFYFSFTGLILTHSIADPVYTPTPDRTIGFENAPIVIIEYSSLTCDHCAKFHLEVLPYLKKEYIDPGHVRLIFREYPSDGIALRAFAICNKVAPEHYFDILEAFYATQQDWVKPDHFIEPLAKVAKDFGLKRHQVNSCVDDEQLLNQIIAKRVEAQKYKVDRTPFFIIEDQHYPYFMDIQEWDVILNKLIQKNQHR